MEGQLSISLLKNKKEKKKLISLAQQQKKQRGYNMVALRAIAQITLLATNGFVISFYPPLGY